MVVVVRRQRLTTVCHWLCQCKASSVSTSKKHWQSQWHAIRDVGDDTAFVRRPHSDLGRFQDRHSRGRRLLRGAASVEVVMATGASFVMMTPLFFMGLHAVKNLSHIVQTLVGWPY